MLIGVGHDLQAVDQLSGRAALLSQPGCFTDAELARIAASPSPPETAAGLFAVKEAFFKASPSVPDGFWTDIEVAHAPSGAPSLILHGAYRARFAERGWRALISISHSGGFASAIVMVEADPARPAARP